MLFFVNGTNLFLCPFLIEDSGLIKRVWLVAETLSTMIIIFCGVTFYYYFYSVLKSRTSERLILPCTWLRAENQINKQEYKQYPFRRKKHNIGLLVAQE